MTDRNTERRRSGTASARRRFLARLAGVTALVAGGSASAAARSTTGDHTATDTRGQEPKTNPSDLVFLSVGDYDCTLVNDGTLTYQNPAQVFYTTAPREELARELRARGIDPAEWNSYSSPIPCLLVGTGDETVLVDTGAGELAPTTGRLVENLRTAGVGPEDIDVVMLTHGHPDHIGGTVDAEGDPAFPDARYVMSRTDWAFWTGFDYDEYQVGDDLKAAFRAAVESKLVPLADRIELLDGRTELALGVTALPAAGHTPGHMSVEVRDGGERLLHLADAGLLPLHVAHPDWQSILDYAPQETSATRRRLYDRAAKTDSQTLGYHFPSPGLGRVRRAGDGYGWDPVTTG